jgi:hypothetical protein
MALRLKSLSNLVSAFTRPPQGRFRITSGTRVNQGIQSLQQVGIMTPQGLASTTALANAGRLRDNTLLDSLLPFGSGGEPFAVGD